MQREALAVRHKADREWMTQPHSFRRASGTSDFDLGTCWRFHSSTVPRVDKQAVFYNFIWQLTSVASA